MEDLERDRLLSGRMFGAEFRKRLREHFIRVKKREQVANPSLSWFARHVGMAYPTLWNIYHSVVLPGDEKLKLLCTALDWPYRDAVKLFPRGKTPRRGRPPGTAKGKWKMAQRAMGFMLSQWYRDAPHLTQNQFLRMAGISFSYWYLLKRGRVNSPSVAVIEQMAKACRQDPRPLLVIRMAMWVPGPYRAELMKAMYRHWELDPDKDLIQDAQERWGD